MGLNAHFNGWIMDVCACVFQFCVSDVGTLSTLITPGATGSIAEPAAGTSERSCDAETGSTNKPGTVAAAKFCSRRQRDAIDKQPPRTAVLTATEHARVLHNRCGC